MQYARISIDLHKQGLKKDDSWFTECLSDIHFGHRNHDLEKFNEAVKRIASQPNRSTYFGGDNSDNIPPRDKRFNPNSVDLTMVEDVQQEDAWVNAIKPLLEEQRRTGVKIYGNMMGNHEWVYYGTERFKKAYCKPTIYDRKLKEEVVVPLNYLGAMAYIWLDFSYKSQFLNSFVIWATHGSYGGSQTGGEVNAMMRLPCRYDADVYLEGHTHQKWYAENTQLSIDESGSKHCKLIERKKIFGNTGTFMKTHSFGVDNYPEKKGTYAKPTRVGTITIEMNPYLKKIHGHE